MVVRGPKAPLRSRGTASIRPPIILQITDSALIAGRAGGIPKHTTPLFAPPTPTKDTPDALYRYFIEPIRSVLYRVAPSTIDGTYVLIVSHDVYPRRTWRTALAQCILDAFGTAVAFVSTLHAIPVALAMVSPTLWVIEIGNQNTNTLQCLVTANDHSLDYTYQSTAKRSEWPRALALSLLQCPVSHRKDAIRNMVVVGAPRKAHTVAKALYHYLQEGSVPEEEDPATDGVTNDENDVDACYYNVDIKPLKVLATDIAVIEYEMGALAWTGASIWASRKANDPACWERSVPEC